MFEDILKDETPRGQLVIIYVINILNELVDMGLMENKVFDISENGLEMIKDMDPPTDEEMKVVIDMLKGEGYIGMKPDTDGGGE